MQVVERRLEQAAEEGGPECQADCVGDACREPMLSFPPGGNVSNKPLDSGLRRAATGILPSRRIQDFLSINDGKGNRHGLVIPLTIATQPRDSCLSATGKSENNLNIQASPE